MKKILARMYKEKIRNFKRDEWVFPKQREKIRLVLFLLQ